MIVNCDICLSNSASYLINNNKSTKTLCVDCMKIFNDDTLMNRILRKDKLNRIIKFLK